jgi:hypothetical protein
MGRLQRNDANSAIVAERAPRINVNGSLRLSGKDKASPAYRRGARQSFAGRAGLRRSARMRHFIKRDSRFRDAGLEA